MKICYHEFKVIADYHRLFNLQRNNSLIPCFFYSFCLSIYFFWLLHLVCAEFQVLDWPQGKTTNLKSAVQEAFCQNDKGGR